VEFAVLVMAIWVSILTLVNLAVFALTLKLYTEFFKQIAQERTRR
jgi:hypothetical protein